MADLPGNITAARETAQQAGSALSELAGGEFEIGDILKKKVQEAYDYSKDIIGPLDEATLDYTGAPTEGRSIFGDPESDRYAFNPFQAEDLISKYTQSKALPMLSLGNVLGQRFGRIDDLIGAGTRAFQADTARKQSAYDVARQNYSDIFSEYQATRPERIQVEVDGRIKLMDATTGEEIADLGAAPVSSGGGGTTINIAGLDGINTGGGGEVWLTDPTTGQSYKYDGYSDPDYAIDIGRGFVPYGTPAKTEPTPTQGPSGGGGLRGIGAYQLPIG